MPRIMSWVGTTIGDPLAGSSRFWLDSISVQLSICASGVSGTCTAIWSPSKSALKAAHTSGCSLIALPSTSTGSKACIPSRCRVGARFRRTGCSLTTSSRTAHTSGVSSSTSVFAFLML